MNKVYLSPRPRRTMALRHDTGRRQSSSIKYYLLLTGVVVSMLSIAIMVLNTDVKAIPVPQEESLSSSSEVTLVLPAQAAPLSTTVTSLRSESRPPITPEKSVTQLQTQSTWSSTQVKRGENLSLIFSRLGLRARELQNMLNHAEHSQLLTHLYPGDEIRYQKTPDGQLIALAYRYNEAHSLLIQYQNQDYTGTIIDHPLEHRAHHVSANIDDSLYLAGHAAGLSDRLVMELAGIFGWDIDFALDIRSGDQFTVIFDQVFQKGEHLRDGDILAAEFINQGHRYRAVRFTDNKGHTDYFTPKGKSLRKAFLRTPVSFTRISSRFTRGRWHPVLHRMRAHKGVDYAAASGTPVKSTSDGKITFRGRKGGYGRVVIIQHGQRYSTLYAHLSAYKRGLRKGSLVRQGQTIGYVGQSGLATGPHLHYEFRINGVHHNPLTVHLPDAAPLPATQMAAFAQASSPLLAQLDILRRQATLIAAR